MNRSLNLLETINEEIMIEGLIRSKEYKIEADIIDKDQNSTEKAMAVVNFFTRKCTPPGKFIGWYLRVGGCFFSNLQDAKKTTSSNFGYSRVADKSNIKFSTNMKKEIRLQFIFNEKNIYNFTLLLKTARGIENAILERKYYTYTIRHIPDGTESLIIAHMSGESIIFVVDTSFKAAFYAFYMSNQKFNVTSFFP